MMISLGYYFDQVSRERLTQRIARAIATHCCLTPTDAPVGPRRRSVDRYGAPGLPRAGHHLAVDGTAIPSDRNQPFLDPRRARSAPRAANDHGDGRRPHAVRSRSGDPRNALTATRSWTVDRGSRVSTAPALPHRGIHGIDADRASDRRQDVVYMVTIRTSTPIACPTVSWRLDGQVVPEPRNSLSFPLAHHSLLPGRTFLTVRSRDRPAGHASGRSTTPSDGRLRAVTPIAAVDSPDGRSRTFSCATS